MRETLVICVILGLVSCGGSLSDKQRKALQKEMETREIKRISEDQIFEKALEIGRAVVPNLDHASADSIAKAQGVRIHFADTVSADLSLVQKQIFEAYVHAPDIRDISDNLQNTGDTIIYTAPVIEQNALKGVWFIGIPRRKIVLAF